MDAILSNVFVDYLLTAIPFGMTFLFGCTGEIITEKVGHLNLGIPGIMCAGTAGGCLGVALYMGGLSNPNEPNYLALVLIGVIMAFLFAGVLGAI